MYISRIIVCILLVSITTFSLINASSANPQSSNNSSQRFIFELSDNLVNSTISKYSFFALDCYVSWCEPCKEMKDTLHQLSSELNGQIAFGTIDVENNSKIANRYNVTNYPTLLIFKNGTLIDSQIGFGSKLKLVDRFKMLMPGLNTSQVNLVTKSQTTAAITAVPTTTRQNDIPLINLGANKPALPMKVNDSTLDFALSNYPFFVLMAFADWCGYCKEMNSTILELSKELNGQVAFGLIDAEKNNNTSTEYDIESYPRFLIFKNRTLVQTRHGYTEKSKFVEILKEVQPSLDSSHVNITTTPQTATVPIKTLTPATGQSKSGTVAVVNRSASEEDPALKYLDRILNYTQTNRTSGSTINIIIINACSQNQGK